MKTIGLFSKRYQCNSDYLLAESLRVINLLESRNENYAFLKDIQRPISCDFKKETTIVESSSWFRKPKKVEEPKYIYYFSFTKDLSEQELLFYRGFIVGLVIDL